MSCQHNTVSRCHSCCSPIVVQVPGLQGTGIVWENITEEEKKDITDRILDPVIDYANKAEESATSAKESLEKTERIFEDTVLASGKAAYEESWTLDSTISAGTEIEIPSKHSYVVGRYQLRVILGGVVLSLGQSLEEVGDTDSLSTKFKLLFDAPAGTYLTVRIEALGKQVVDDAALAYATKAGEYASQAKSNRDEIINHQGEIVNKVTAEGDYQISRIKGEVDNTLVTNGVGGYERFWTVPADIAAGTLIEIPGTIKYIVGRHHFHVSWNGLQLYLGQNFEEVGTEDTASTTFKLTFDVSLGDELDIKVSALGTGEVSEAIALAGEASAAVADLSRKVVYKEETT